MNRSCILPFNEITKLINKYRFGDLKKHKKQKIKTEVGQRNSELQERLSVQLASVENKNKKFLEKLSTSLYLPGTLLKLIEN